MIRHRNSFRIASSLAAAGLCLAAPAAQAQDAKQSLMSEDPAAREFQNSVGYADAVIVGDTIYLSGVVAGPAPGDDGMAPAFERAFAHLETILARAGATWDDVVDFTTFHTDLAGQIETFAEVKNRYIKAPFPAWTAIGITALYEPTAWVEIKIVARKPPG